MTDDQDKGMIQGTISNLIYKGDHYCYVIHTELEQDFVVDDEYLWNMGDRVSLLMPVDKMTFKTLKSKKGRLHALKLTRKSLGIPYAVFLVPLCWRRSWYCSIMPLRTVRDSLRWPILPASLRIPIRWVLSATVSRLPQRLPRCVF